MLTNIHRDVAQTRESERHSGLIWFAEECMNNGAPLESYIIHAERIGDRELAEVLPECPRRVPPGAARRPAPVDPARARWPQRASPDAARP